MWIIGMLGLLVIAGFGAYDCYEDYKQDKVRRDTNIMRVEHGY